ncbi:MAG: hypothetical protein B2I17_02070 [Thermoplasmatales archaeon B_DKE]|nr:MAG: hypothetical protein B2I17_02070 [Thermoplasmatales archaeon B_DKE]
MLIGIDIGGTFTDLVIYDTKTAQFEGIKVPTTPQDPKKAVIGALGKRKDLATQTELIFHATTIATNALLTRKGLPRIALLTTEGFRDVLEIGRQRRAEIYNLYNSRPEPLVKRAMRFTVNERIGASGDEIEKLDKTEVESFSKKIKQKDVESVAISFINSYRNAEHEIQAEQVLRKTFYGHISISSRVNPEYREYERTSTTVVNASLSPIVSHYLEQLKDELKNAGYNSPLYVMNSGGGLDTVRFASEYPVSIIESGPAAGVLASRYLANTLSLGRVITFDMGGTTAKAGTVIDGNPDVAYEFEAAGKTHSGRSIKGSGYAVRHPFIDLAEASAGGGTIAWVDEGGILRVGPQSAGSEPGPAAYGRGGELATITDAHILLGHINPEYLLAGSMKVYRDLASQAVTELSSKLGMGVNDTAEGILKLINNSMAKILSIVSVERGRDPRDFTMLAFGGAGPLHACDMADDLHISYLVIPQHPGLFSAYGLLTGDMVRVFSSPVMTTNLDVGKEFESLKDKAIEDLKTDGLKPSKLMELMEMRYIGQSYEIVLPYEPGKDLRKEFDLKHKELYGYSSTDQLEIINLRVHAVVKVDKVSIPRFQAEEGTARPDHYRNASFDGVFEEIPVYVREKLHPGDHGKGPSIIEEYDSTTKVNRNWSFRLDEYGNIRMKKEVSS